MEKKLILDEKDLELNDPQGRVWVRVRDAAGLLWVENPKLHNLGSISESLIRNGLRIIPNFDARLPNVSQEAGSEPEGAVVDGNGRVEALAMMERQGAELPRGMALDADGAWCMPLGVGVDAATREQAEAFALDANNLVLAGDSTPFDAAKLWDEGRYLALLRRLGASGDLPASVDGDALDALVRAAADEPPGAFPEYGEDVETKHECPRCGYSWS